MANAVMAVKVGFYGVMICWAAFALTFWLRKRQPRSAEAKRDRRSYFGILLQAVGYFIMWLSALGRRGLLLHPSGSEATAWVIAILAILVAAVSVCLVIWAVRRLGRQWAIGARLVEGHRLVEDGPYRFIRNPIYTGMLGMLVATGLVFQRWIWLIVAIIVFLAGSIVRIRVEESLLRGAFGEQFEDYRRRVKAMIPGVY